MIPGILPAAFHTQLSPHNSKEIDYYSQLVNEKKEVQRTTQYQVGLPCHFTISILFSSQNLSLSDIHTYIYFLINAYIYLFPYIQIICRPKKVESHYTSGRVTFIQQSSIYKTTQLRIQTISHFPEMLIHRYICQELEDWKTLLLPKILEKKVSEQGWEVGGNGGQE